MAGIYFHIPFCQQACYYCDFHFSTNQNRRGRMIEAMREEVFLQKNYLSESINTIYFGGGTPSLLNFEELERLFFAIYECFEVSAQAEITLEANPDDITEEKLAVWKKLKINRLSIGIQSFHEPHLRYMNRSHHAEQAQNAVFLAKKAGFENITIDLIYGVPAPDHVVWENDLRTAFSLPVQHLSAYCLTIEPQTVFGKWLKKKKIQEVTDQFAEEQFEKLLEESRNHGFVQYEISNFGKPDFFSQHNTNYWKRSHYLGIGASAHSYNGVSRQYNVAHNERYMSSLEKGIVPFEREILQPADHANEYLMTGLRTIWGVDFGKIKALGFDLEEIKKDVLEKYKAQNWLKIEKNSLFLTDQGKLWADRIASELFVS